MFQKLKYLRAKFKYYFYRFSWQITYHYKLNEAYKKREWSSFDLLLERRNKNSILYRSWNAMKLSYFMSLDNPIKIWGDIHNIAHNKKHFLASFAFRNYIYAIIGEGDLNLLKKEIQKFESLYNSYCPLIYLPGICALHVKHGEYSECITLLNKWKSLIDDEVMLGEFNLKSLPYFVICTKHTLKGKNNKRKVSEELLIEMQNVFVQKSPARTVLESCKKCWKEIGEEDSELLLDMRYDNSEVNRIRDLVRFALVEKKPYLLLRIGDGEAYAFANSSKEYKSLIIDTLENFWWDTSLEYNLRKKLVNDFLTTFREADIIGFPHSIRLSQVVSPRVINKLSFSDIRLKVLYEGVEKDLKKNKFQSSVWTDEYCNYAFVDKDYLLDLFEISTNVVLVTCFDIPENNIFNHPKVSVVHTPPVKKISKVENVVSFQKSLPELMENLRNEIKPMLSHGTLLLLSGGFAGKSVLKLGKDSGAVSIDFGSSIDHLMGYRTRNLELHNLFD